MTEGINGPEGQAISTPAPAATPASGSAPEGFVEAARLNGALRKIEELTLLNKTLTERMTGLTSEKTTLQADLQQKEGVWNAQQSEFTTKLGSAEKTIAELNTKLASHEAMKLKMKLIEELKAPQLYSVIDVIPDGTDEAVMKTAIQKLAGFAHQIAQSREKELTAGLTTIEQNQGPQLSTTDKGWQELIAGLSFGTPEYQKAMEGWHSWLFNQK
jgi:hypothetical protein